MAKYKVAPKYTVIRDSREQEGHFFGNFNRCEGTVVEKLDTGDYTVLGLEDKLCIERKSSVEEIAVNLGKGKYAFYNEIERMMEFPHKYLVLEFSVEDVMGFPENSRVPYEKRKDVKISAKYIMKCLVEFQVFNDIHVVFCGSRRRAFDYMSSVFKRINEKYTTGRLD